MYTRFVLMFLFSIMMLFNALSPALAAGESAASPGSIGAGKKIMVPIPQAASFPQWQSVRNPYVGVLVERYQPTVVNSNNDTHYTSKVTVNGKNQWFIPIAQATGTNFEFRYDHAATRNTVLGSKAELDAAGATHNIATGNTKFRFVIYHVFRLDNGEYRQSPAKVIYYTLNSPPVITISSPPSNQTFSTVPGYNSIPVSGTTRDTDVGDILKVYRRIDGSAGQAGVQIGSDITADGTEQVFGGSVAVDGSLISEGTHTLYVWTEDNKGGKSPEVSRTFYVDKTAPSVSAPTVTVTGKTTITVSPNANDPVSNGVSSGLHATPHLYRRDGVDVTSWVSGNLLDTGLTPNKQYAYRTKARDATGNESGYSASEAKYTLANNPLSVSKTGTTEITVTLSIANDPANANTPQWRIELKQGATTIATSDWSTNTSRTLTGLSASTTYEIWVTTRNGDNIANATVQYGTVSTNAPPTISNTAPAVNTWYSAQPGRNTINATGTVRDTDIGDMLTVYYRINGSAGQPGAQWGSTITADGTNQAYSGSIDVSGQVEGNHTLYRWVEDNAGGKSSETSTPFRVDKTNPTATISLTGTGTYPNYSGSVTVSYTLADALSGIANASATYEKNGGVPVTFSTNPTGSVNLTDSGSYVIRITVTDNAGNVHIEQQSFIISDANLTALSFSAFALTPAFDSNTTNYTATVPFETNNTNVTPTASDTNATIQITNATSSLVVGSGVPSGPWSIPVGTSNFIVQVTSGGSNKTYTVTVTREASSNNTLNSLVVFPPGGNLLSGGELLTYTVNVNYTIGSVVVIPTFTPAIDEIVVIEANGVRVQNGAASGPMNLIVGANQVDVGVYAQNQLDGMGDPLVGATPKTYTIIVARAAEQLTGSDPLIEIIQW